MTSSRIKNSTLRSLSVAICTHNRSELLDHCIRSVLEQTVEPGAYELLVIDNASTDDTKAVTQQYVDNERGVRVRYIYEEKLGLSHARNRAIEEADAPWILYLDDDAKAKEDLVAQCIKRTGQSEYKLIGGVYYPWYYYGQPYWFKERYGSNKMKYTRLTSLPPHKSASGGVMLAEVETLRNYGGFNPEYGMKGIKVKYGEETRLQEKMRADGLPIGYDPDMVIYHVVATYKLSTDWFIKRHFAIGEYIVSVQRERLNGLKLFMTFIITSLFTTLRLLYYTPQLLQSDYYIENWLIDVFRKTAKRIAIIYRSLLHRSQRKHSD